jgi:hypothetical protein
VLRRDGTYAGVSLWEGYSTGNPHKIAVQDGTGARMEKTEALFSGWSEEFPPMPRVDEQLRKDSLK